MRTKCLTALCVLALGWAGAAPVGAADVTPETVVADALIGRPACLAATVVGSACFVVALPFALLSKSTKQTARLLVVQPARATFVRPLGNFDDLGE